MIDEIIAYNRTKNQIKRKEGMLTYQDLVEAHSFFGKKCPYSETPIVDSNWHLEHIIPVAMGGTTDSWNCFPICSSCNLSKGSKHLLDWWDETHSIEEEYLLAKIFEYIVKKLSEDRKVRISSKEDIEK